MHWVGFLDIHWRWVLDVDTMLGIHMTLLSISSYSPFQMVRLRGKSSNLRDSTCWCARIMEYW